MRVSTSQIIEFASDGSSFVMVTDRDIAERLRRRDVRHCRSGKIDMRCNVKEARGVAVHAYKYDELNNVIALCADGIVRQFIR